LFVKDGEQYGLEPDTQNERSSTVAVKSALNESEPV
jgi:hypothetical protein